MTSIMDILAELRDDARNNRDLGDRVERLIQSFLTQYPLYAVLFSDMWLWVEASICCSLNNPNAHAAQAGGSACPGSISTWA